MQRLNLFYRTKFSRAEEDRATNALLILLQHSDSNLVTSFLDTLGISAKVDAAVTRIEEQVFYSEGSRIDAEIEFGKHLLIAIESKAVPGQLEDSEQLRRHLEHLEKQRWTRQYLLILSPDASAPSSAVELGSTYRTNVIWSDWDSVYKWSLNQLDVLPEQSTLSRYLLTHFAEYLGMVGLSSGSEGNVDSERFRSQLRVLVGSETTEKILLLLYHHGQLHVRGIERLSGLALGTVQQGIGKLYNEGIVTRSVSGNRHQYSLNTDSPLLPPLKSLLQIVYQSFSEEEKVRVFGEVGCE